MSTSAGPATVTGMVGEPITPPRGWRPKRSTIGLALILLAALGAILLVTRSAHTGYLDPAAVDPSGSRAVANVLADNGVQVMDVQLTADVLKDAAGSTVLVTSSGLLTRSVVEDLLASHPGRIVVVSGFPGDPLLDRLGAGIEIASGDFSDGSNLEPGCDYPPAVRAGTANLPGERYDARAWADTGQACYDGAGSAALVVLPAQAARPEVVLLASAKPLMNDGFATAGNASLILSLLGSREQLIWWRPQLADPAIVGSGGQSELSELVPSWVIPVLLQLFVACLFLAWWRSRRMGPLVTEPLPVVVRAGETTAGRARLLQASRARGTAATHLRELTREQVRSILALPLGAPPGVIVESAARRTNRLASDVGALLYGADPASDAELVALTNDLQALAQEVRRP